MKEILFVCIIFGITYSTTGQAECNTPDGGFGTCKFIQSCPELLKISSKVSRQPTLIHKLKSYATCATSYQFCCPDCYTPNGKAGICKPDKECNHIMEMENKRHISESDMYYLMHSLCDGKDDIYNVCCGPPPPISVPNIESCVGKMSAFPPAPDSNCCGVEATSPVRIMGGTVTGIDEYPWLVLLEFRDLANNMIKLNCGGSLISGKYVLTAAHCVSKHNGYQLINVRVGEYDTDNAGKDCVKTAEGYDDCTHPAISVPIEEIIAHPEYNPGAKLNDIALLRLSEAVEFTDFVRPICLPSTNIEETSFATMKTPLVAGWGMTNNHNESRSRYKQDVEVPFMRMKDCQDNYKELMTYNSPSLWSRQICAGGERGKDSCNGDSGGPLMNIRTWRGERNTTVYITEVIGVVSFGSKTCGTKNLPGVYTKVFDYIPWIRSNIKP